MKETRKPSTTRYPAELPWGGIVTENAYDIDGTLPSNQGVSLENVDLFQGHMKTRRAAEYLGGTNPPSAFAGEALNSVTWSVDGTEYAVLQFEDGFWYRIVDNTGDDWLQIRDYNYYTETDLGFMASSSEPCRFTKAADKLYVFQGIGNSVVEFVPTATIPGLKRRDVGMGRPTITGYVSGSDPATSQEAGEYVYAVEYVYRKEIGTPSEADYLASTPQRYQLNQAAPEIFRYTTTGTEVIKIEFDTFDVGADDLWTHVKLYRSKKINQDVVTEEVFGTENELYLIQMYERSHFDTNPKEFAFDLLNDDSLPVIPLGAETVIYPDMDQKPLVDANIGVYHSNRVWVTDLPDNIVGSTELVYTSNTAFKYTEQFNETFRVPCNIGDGQSITDLVSLEDDLIVFKQAQTGRIPTGIPERGYEKLDDSVGVADKAFFVPKVGIVGLVNDQSDVRIFGYDLVWRTEFRGIPFSRPVRGVFEAKAPGNPGQPGYSLTGVVYFEGKLLLSVGTRIWAFHVSENLGWSHYELGYVNSGQQVSMLLTTTLQDRCFFMVDGFASVLEFGSRESDEFNGELVPWEIQTSGFQVDGGRGFVEQRYVSLMAALTQPASMSVAYTGRDNELKDDEPFVLDPSEVNPDVQNVIAEYQYYAKHNYPERTRIYADRLFYTVKSTGYAEIKDLKLYCFLQTGMRPGTVSTKNSQDNDEGIIADLSSGQLHWQTRDDMSKDRKNPNDSSKPFQEISFIVMRAP